VLALLLHRRHTWTKLKLQKTAGWASKIQQKPGTGYQTSVAFGHRSALAKSTDTAERNQITSFKTQTKCSRLHSILPSNVQFDESRPGRSSKRRALGR
jgi:hypothetical protein